RRRRGGRDRTVKRRSGERKSSVSSGSFARRVRVGELNPFWEVHMRGLSRSLSIASLLLFAFVAIASADHRKSPPPTPVRTDPTFRAVPDAKLDVRAVQYDGSTNGKLVVQVKNNGKSAQKFSAQGLYFVPEGNPDSAPQRLGAVGPMQVVADPQHKELT